MNFLIPAVTVLHVFVCIFLIIVVLLQSGKSADIAGTFGGVGSQTAFGPRGAASALSRATTIAVIMFMLTSMSLSIWSSRRSSTSNSVLDTVKPSQNKNAPAAPATAPPIPQQSAPAQPKK